MTAEDWRQDGDPGRWDGSPISSPTSEESEECELDLQKYKSFPGIFYGVIKSAMVIK